MCRMWWTFIVIIAVFLAAIFIDLPRTNSFLTLPVKVNKGIDIAGGVRLLMCANYVPSTADSATSTECAFPHHAMVVLRSY